MGRTIRRKLNGIKLLITGPSEIDNNPLIRIDIETLTEPVSYLLPPEVLIAIASPGVQSMAWELITARPLYKPKAITPCGSCGRELAEWSNDDVVYQTVDPETGVQAFCSTNCAADAEIQYSATCDRCGSFRSECVCDHLEYGRQLMKAHVKSSCCGARVVYQRLPLASPTYTCDECHEPTDCENPDLDISKVTPTRCVDGGGHDPLFTMDGHPPKCSKCGQSFAGMAVFVDPDL